MFKNKLFLFCIGIFLLGCNKESKENCEKIQPASISTTRFLSVGSYSDLDLEAKTYGSCQDLLVHLTDLKKRKQTIIDYDWGQCGANPAPDMSISAPSTSDLNLQEVDVSEPDILSVSKNSILLARNNSVEQLTKRLPLINKTLSLNGLVRPKLAYVNNLLIVIAEDTARHFIEVLFFQEAKSGVLILRQRQKVQGQYVESRVLKNEVIILSSNDITLGSLSRPYNKEYLGIACNKIHQPMHPIDAGLLMGYHRIPLHGKSIESVGFIGTRSVFYQTAGAAYLAGHIYLSNQKGSDYYTLLQKISLNEDLTKISSGVLVGQADQRWAFKELKSEKYLSVATTFTNEMSQIENKLTILNEKLSPVAELQDFAPGETIRAIRYVNEFAYVVTFKKVDPLYAINLKDPLHPRITEELEVPGFSTYLLPLTKQRLFGLGFDTYDMGDFAWFQGLQLSLFQHKNFEQLKVIQQAVAGGRGSESDALNDSHALFYDQGMDLLGLPVIERPKHPDPSAIASELSFSGAMLFDVSTDLKLLAKISHWDLIPMRCQTEQSTRINLWSRGQRSLDINRLLKIESGIVSLSRFGARVHSLEKPSNNLQTIEFPQADAECQSSLL